MDNQLKEKKIILIIALILTIFLAASFLYLKINQNTKKPLANQPVNPSVKSPPTSQTLTQAFRPPAEFREGHFLCPSTQEFCITGQDIYIGPIYLGFGGVIKANNTPIFAAFDGELTTSKVTIPGSPLGNKTQDIFFSFLTDKAHLLRAAYYFKGQPSKDRTVKKGEIIATGSGESMPLYQDSSLVFVLTRNDKVMGEKLGGERVHLTKDNFK